MNRKKLVLLSVLALGASIASMELRGRRSDEKRTAALVAPRPSPAKVASPTTQSAQLCNAGASPARCGGDPGKLVDTISPVAPSPALPSFAQLVAEYNALSDDQITDTIAQVDEELAARDLIQKANREQLDGSGREQLRGLLRRYHALQAVRTQRLLAEAEGT